MNRFLQWFQSGFDAEKTPENNYRAIREYLLTGVLIGGVIGGAIVYVSNVNALASQSSWEWLIIYTIGFAWIVAVAFVRKISYYVRVYSLIVVTYAFGIVSAMQYGAAGDARIWFMGTALFTSIFLGLWEGLGALFFTAVTYLGIGWMMSQALLTVPAPEDLLQFDNFASWTSTSTSYAAIGAMTIISIGMLVNGLKAIVQQSNEYAETLANRQSELQEESNALKRREIQIRTAAEISQTAISELDLNIVLQRVADLMQTRFDLYYVGIFLLDKAEHYAILRAGTGQAGKQMLANKFQLAISSTSMIGYAISNKEALIASNVEMETARFANPYLPETQAELALPMIAGDRTLGAISIQSTQPNAFDQDDIIVYQGIADSLAIAVDNARLFQQLQESLQEIQEVQRQYIRQSWMAVADRRQGISYTHRRETSKEVSSSLQEIIQPATIEVPLALRDETIGRLTMEMARPTLTSQEQKIVDAVIQQTALALENIRLVEETQRTARKAHVVSTIADELSRAMDVETVIKAAVHELGRLPGVNEAAIYIEPSHSDKS